MLDLRPYREREDGAAVYALWQAALGRQWPIDIAAFLKLLTGSPLREAALTHLRQHSVTKVQVGAGHSVSMEISLNALFRSCPGGFERSG
jgi:hypothetical protein